MLYSPVVHGAQHPAPSAGTFQVDLRGVVDLLSRHLYSSPRVYLRELMQNAVDAAVVRGEADDRPTLTIVPTDVASDGRLHALDSGVGLDEADVRAFLATVGRSSKRDDLGFARGDLLGQFGIGLLSCFMVSDTVEVVTRRADGPLVWWRGHHDGTFELASAAERGVDDERTAWLARGPGTCVTLTPLPDAAHLLDTTGVVDLARRHGTYLPHRVVVRTGTGEVTTSGTTPPWRLPDPVARHAACTDLAEQHLGEAPFHVLPIRVPEAGLDGIAIVTGRRAAADQGRHRVHVKGMLLADSVPDLAPDWAFFVRCVVDADHLRLTADREGLVDDDLLEQTRAEIGSQIRAWLVRMASTQPARMRRFLDVHAVAVKGMALVDDEALGAVLPLLPFETTQGTCTLPELFATTDVVRVVASVDEYRQVAGVLAAQGVAVVNGGYTHDLELLRRYPQLDPSAVVEVVAAADVESHLRPVDAQRHAEVATRMGAVRAVLDELQVDAELREFAPASQPALLVDDATRRARRTSRAVAAAADDLWSGVLARLDDGGGDRPLLLLNDANPTVRRVLDLVDDDLRRLAAESLYGRALLASRSRLRPVDSTVIDRSFNALLDRAVAAAADRPGPEVTAP